MPISEASDIAIVVAGQAGQGIQTIEAILTRALKRSGYHVFGTKEYMSRIRGGSNSTLIRVGRERVPANVDRIDILVPLDDGALEHVTSRLSPETVIIGEGEKLSTDRPVIDVSFSGIAEEAGGKIYANTVAIAVLFSILGGPPEILNETLSGVFGRKGDDVVEGNLKAASLGMEVGRKLRSDGTVEFRLGEGGQFPDEVLISGGEAVTLGAISGGCNFVASYPMSPGTAVLSSMARHDEGFGIVVEQAEDEIAAVNMAIGAWYAGGRAMVTTSGGGFSLMEEGLSLAGMTESPLVVHIGQRPGPATGMATRTEQADLELAIYAGQGEFPRVVYAPGSIEEAFSLTHRAFNTADRFQVPVFVLTDQYFIDSFTCTPSLQADSGRVEDHTVRTGPDYRRYAPTPDGVSPRGIPGKGEGRVCVDSHEHTEDGHITEGIELRNRMMEKRMGKERLLLEDCVAPTLIGPKHHPNLVICWGSTLHIAAEAVKLLGRDDTAVLHYSQVFPLHPDTEGLLGASRMTIVVESNYSGQFQRLLRAHTGFEPSHSIRKYDGRPFCAEALAGQIRHLLKEGRSG